MISKLILAALVLTPFSQLAIAQETAGLKAELRLLAFSSDITVTEAYAHDVAGPADATGVKVTIQSYLNHDFSSLVLRSRKIAFSTKPDRASLTRGGELVGEVALPEGGDSSILLFLPGKAGAKQMYQVMPIPDSKRAFPAGSFHCTNLSNLPVRLTLESQPYDFKPAQAMLIENAPVQANGHSAMRAFAFKDNEWMKVSTGLWPSPGESRTLIIFYQDTLTGNLRLQAYDDVPPRTAKEQATAKP